jgi:predicted XRE-type DNA-binding protein
MLFVLVDKHARLTQRVNMTNEDVSKRITKAIKEKAKLTHLTGKKELSTEDKFKIGLCRHFVQFANAKKMKLKDLAQLIEVPVPRLSEISNYKIKKFTVDQLLKNLSLLAAHDAAVRAYLSFLEEAIELPLLKTNETKKLTKKIRDVSAHFHR